MVWDRLLWIRLAAMSGFISVAAGAFAAHGIADPAAKESDALNLNRVVVTGTTSNKSKMRSSVSVTDVGKAVAYAVTSADAAGQTYELGGPATLSFRQLMEMLLAQIGKRRLLLPLPWPAAALLGSAGDMANSVAGIAGLSLPTPVTADQVILLKSDNVASGAYPGLTEMGITPTTLEAVLRRSPSRTTALRSPSPRSNSSSGRA